MVDVKKYREKNEKPLTTRSGETFTICKISPFRLLEIFTEAGFSSEELRKKDIPREEAMALAKVMLPECVLEIAPVGEGDTDHLAIDEITDLSELEDLIDGVLAAVGVREEDLKEAEDFRGSPDVADGGAGSEDVPGLGSADRDPEVTG